MIVYGGQHNKNECVQFVLLIDLVLMLVLILVLVLLPSESQVGQETRQNWTNTQKVALRGMWYVVRALVWRPGMRHFLTTKNRPHFAMVLSNSHCRV